MSNVDTSPKIVIFIGDTGVGKTSIIKRFIEKEFDPDLTRNIGTSYFACTNIFRDIEIKLHIWDTAGSKEFRALGKNYYRNANLAVFVCDTTSIESVNCLVELINNLEEERTDIKKVLVGNKIDLIDEIKVTNESIQNFAKVQKFNGISTTSAKTGQGINNLFNLISNLCSSELKTREGIDITAGNNDRNDGCC